MYTLGAFVTFGRDVMCLCVYVVLLCVTFGRDALEGRIVARVIEVGYFEEDLLHCRLGDAPTVRVKWCDVFGVFGVLRRAMPRAAAQLHKQQHGRQTHQSRMPSVSVILSTSRYISLILIDSRGSSKSLVPPIYKVGWGEGGTARVR